MNWILDTYSNVYSTAMMQGQTAAVYAAPAKEPVHAKGPGLFKFLRRR